MRIVIEEYQYPADRVRGVLDGISTLRDIEGYVSVNYVGYYYNPALKDCVFILPKVILDGNGLVFGHCSPEDIIDLEGHKELLTAEEHDFIYELSVWIYRAIVVYRDSNERSTIVLQQNVQQMAKGRLRQCNTFLDILLALLKFNRDNQDFFFFILRNIHSGFNKINWTRTISHSTAFMQDDAPVYLDPVNKKRQINFGEELLVIFFSILRYISRQYGFPVKLNINFPLITDSKFDSYRNGLGKTRLLQIKYKYFSDKALYLWQLCYAFFDQSKKINVETDDKEYLLVKNFNIVFEAIIDELVGDPREQLPEGIKDQPDGKRVDHLFSYQKLTRNADADEGRECPVYYIGDSKYYKRGTNLGDESVYKQFTYARNLIQWNLDIFRSDDSEQKRYSQKLQQERIGHRIYRDEVTEGYNIIPNFFISAQQKDLRRQDDIRLTDRTEKCHISTHFENRLYDRDTFLIAHYDVNFLYVVSLYGRNNSSEKQSWKQKVRRMFRSEIQNMLTDKFNFHVMAPRHGVNASAYIQEHFQQLLGKVFTPYEDDGNVTYYSLALSKDVKHEEENAALLSQLELAFHIKACGIDDDPSEILKDVTGQETKALATLQFLTMHFLEKYALRKDKENKVLIGCYHGAAHLAWIEGDNDRGTLIYNIRLGSDIPGGQVKAHLENMTVSFVVIYQEDEADKNRYKVFHVHHHAVMTKDRLLQSWYPNKNPSADKYFCYVFDEEVTLGNLDIAQAINDLKDKKEPYAPIFVSCAKLINYRRP